jgi:hypothetical protein
VKFLRTICWRDPEHCDAFTLHGADNEPAQLDLYDTTPDHTTPPFAIYHRVDGVLVTEYVATTEMSRPPSTITRAKPARKKGKS